MEYCNNKEYESAYNLLDEDFKNLYFEDIDNFKKYINVVFKTKRIYNTEYYSNTDNIYIYNVKMIGLQVQASLPPATVTGSLSIRLV